MKKIKHRQKNRMKIRRTNKFWAWDFNQHDKDGLPHYRLLPCKSRDVFRLELL